MKNETIKTYTPITVEQAAQLQREGETDFRVSHDASDFNTVLTLDAISHDGCAFPFYSSSRESFYEHCAKVTELDPCVAPEGCPELEPWMAYVGLLSDQKRQPADFHRFLANEPSSLDWRTHCRGGCNSKWPCCIDVRTAWAQEHFPEHCRIRNYQEPRTLEDWVYDRFCKKGIDPTATYMSTGQMLKDLYKFGQQNPIK